MTLFSAMFIVLGNLFVAYLISFYSYIFAVGWFFFAIGFQYGKSFGEKEKEREFIAREEEIREEYESIE